MPFKFKTSVQLNDELEKALKNRILEDTGIAPSARELDSMMKIFSRDTSILKVPEFAPGSIMFSEAMRSVLKDNKMFVHLSNARISSIEDGIKNASSEAFSLLDDIQQQAMILDSEITEEEIKIINGYTTVHSNSFVRPVDYAVDFDESKDWTADYKTGKVFVEKYKSKVFPSAGLTLPAKQVQNVPVVNAEISGEDSDFGDSRKPILSTSARNLLIKDKVFRHIILRKEFDASGRRYTANPSECTLLLEMPNVQTVNCVEIQPAGQSSLFLKNVSYVNESNEEFNLITQETAVDSNTTVFFEAVKATHLKLTFIQYAPVTKTAYSIKDIRVSEINKTLKGLGMSILLPESEESMQGRVFDFSIKNIQPKLVTYEHIGIFRSHPISVKNPISASLDFSKRYLGPVEISRNNFEVPLTLPENTVLDEYYLGTKLYDADGNKLIEELVPVPDTYPNQVEFLAPVGNTSKIKLFPDLLNGFNKIEIESVTAFPGGLPYVTVVTKTAHGLTGTETITVLGRQDSPFNGDFEIRNVVDTTTLNVIVPMGAAAGSAFEANTFPTVYLYVATGVNPIEVREQSTLLSIGTDYEVSIDAGKTFLSTWPSGQQLVDALRNPCAGRFLIKVLNISHDKMYWISYRPLSTQYLSKTKLVSLKNGKVVFDKKLSASSGSLQTVIVQRSENDNMYNTSVTPSYSLKVRENVS